MASSATTSTSASPRPSSPNADRPERSRNAKAQARHRAKRKAYIEQLEQTVTKLQTALALSPDQVAALPPPSARIRQLEHENQALRAELDDVRRQLSIAAQSSGRYIDEYPKLGNKRRRSSLEDAGYIVRPASIGDGMPLTAQYAYQSPDQTPSPPTTAAYARGSYTPPQSSSYTPSPAQNQSSLLGYSLVRTTDPSDIVFLQTPAGFETGPSNSSLGLPSRLSFPASLYDTAASVKLEDEAYLAPSQTSNLGYAFGQTAELGAWHPNAHAYSADRTQITH
ncbi:hypothetical protein PENSPDRAFT_680910 [Peniophora sp. CONT]|nr:hypothetical protein PENSPDRAFT_680910 [Peniophora sp. CONT]